MQLIQVLLYATPVGLAAIGETVAQRAGVIDIGLEGFMLVGAFVGVVAAEATGSWPLAMSAAILAGVLFALLQGLFALKLRSDQIVVGTAINLLAFGLTSTLYRQAYGQTGRPVILPELPKLFGLDPVVIGFLALVLGLELVLRSTRVGLVLRACGEYPAAVEASGFSVPLLRLAAMCVAGALAALGGAYLSIGLAGSFAEGMTAGRGFVAIAMVTFGRWRPLWVLGASLLMGFAESLQYLFQALGWRAPYQLFLALPYLVALGVLVAAGRGTAAPAALGRPFKRSA